MTIPQPSHCARVCPTKQSGRFCFSYVQGGTVRSIGSVSLVSRIGPIVTISSGGQKPQDLSPSFFRQTSPVRGRRFLPFYLLTFHLFTFLLFLSDHSGLYPKLFNSFCELRQSLSTFTKVSRKIFLSKKRSRLLRASVDIFFSAMPWCPMMIPFWLLRST